MRLKLVLVSIATFIFSNVAISQLPVEVFVGNKKTTFDLMFFRYFKNREGTNSKFLFFNRNRVSIDYKQTTTAYLPAFGFTEAISYNHSKLKGFAPVLVAQISNRGIFPKSGVQYFFAKNNFTYFSWVVCEILEEPNIDLFVLARFQPKLTTKLNLFTQLELVNSFPTISANNFNFIQRVRLGLKMREWQFGGGVDFNEFGNTTFTHTTNIGGFVRHEF